ncbi:DUF3857 domain-containing protein [Alkalitalea saponilacus]|uniref:DUF3857 domain-containing protein n=1 Tax=Alkalitalea saponilacus TaxID=889453 RepID=A0A1T5BYZ7_9BACT|nr:DUF3857 domain-containing protein [Alkalitalea saponilacus]ASB49534.1 hypothetical protein CDL62_10475 [Alkalitalea saponilacus]SKB52355.1 protein of unknown function [Alkalitalea saponilacus]
MKNILILSYLLFLFPAILKGQSHDAELMSLNTSVSINSGRLFTKNQFEIKINNRGGERHSDVVIPFSTMNRVSNIEAFILDANGNKVKKLSRRDIKERSTISGMSFYRDRKEKYFTLSHNEYPYTLVYSFQMRQREFVYLASWTPVLNLDVPTRHATLEVDIPASFEINIHKQFIDQYSFEESEARVSHRWETSYDDLIVPENFSPSLHQFLPSVDVVPLHFRYAKSGSQTSWVEFGNWQYSLLEGKSDLPLAEKLKINSLVSEVICQREKTKILYQYLQNTTRYVNVSIETGGLNPYPASYVARNRYGDCKALTNYFKAVLEHVGVSSYYTLIWAGDRRVRPINKEFPATQFNHAILGVFLDGDTIWLDCTSKGPFNYPGTFNQNREALLIDNNNSRFVDVPAFKKTDVKRERLFSFSSPSNSNSSVRITTVYRGAEFETLYMVERFMQRNTRDQFLRNEFLIKGFDVIGFELKEPDFFNHEVAFEQVASSRNTFVKVGEDKMLIRILPLNIPAFVSSEERKLPVKLDIPIYYSDVLEYNLPEGYIFIEEDTEYVIRDKAGFYRRASSYDQGKITVEKEFFLNQGEYTSEDYIGLYEFTQQVRSMESNGSMIIHQSKDI